MSRTSENPAPLAISWSASQPAMARSDRAAIDHPDVFDTAPCGIVVVDGSGRIVDVNARALRDLGYERRELVGASVETLVPDALRASHATRRADFRPRAQHAMGASRHLSARRKDGTTFAAEVALSSVGGGRVAAFLVDISDRVRAEEAVASAELQLRACERLASLGTLAAGVAHEIRNPLSVIYASLAVLEPGAKDKSTAEAIADMQLAAERIRAVLDDLKVLSRCDAQPTLGPIDVRKVIQSSLRMVVHELRPRAKIVQQIGEIPPVLGNEHRLMQVVVNLLLNAAQAIAEGRPTENEIRLNARVDCREHVVVEVADTGSGMSEEVRRRVFEPFFTTKPLGIGTGLGLSICNRIVTSMGGKIDVESSFGRGTIIRVLLPRAPEGAVAMNGEVPSA